MSASRLRSSFALVASVALVLTFAACGSRIDPSTVQAITSAEQGVEGGPVQLGGSAAGGSPQEAGSLTVPGAGGPNSSTTRAGGGGPAAGGGTAAPSVPGGGTKADSPECEGLEEQIGVTQSTVRIGNASDVSGPVPGLFEGAVDGVRAYVAFFNATSTLCGRKLELVDYDTRTDSLGNQTAYLKGCEEVLAMVGSASGFDQGGVAEAEECGLPDLRSRSVTIQRSECTVCFSTNAAASDEVQNAPADYALRTDREAATNAASLYADVEAGEQASRRATRGWTARGMNFVYEQAIPVAEFNYGPYVQRLKDEGVGFVIMSGAGAMVAKLANAMEQANYQPRIWMQDATSYSEVYTKPAGDSADGTTVFVNFTPFEEAASSREMTEYLRWLQAIEPGATPTYEGVYAWSAAKLFVQEAIKLGGKLNRVSLLEAFRRVDDWTAGDLHAPQPVGPKGTTSCWRFLQYQDGGWRPVGGREYTCAGTSRVDLS